MNAPQFTPGPWGPMTDGPSKREPWEPWSAHLEAAGGLTIGSVHNTEPVARVSGYCQPCEANARLIAAAPELYEALDGLLHALHPANQRIAAQNARDVLAKARGEQ